MKFVLTKIDLTFIAFYILFIQNACAKEKSVTDKAFLSKEIDSFGKKNKCHLTTMSRPSVSSLWYKDQVSSKTHICLLRYLESKIKDSIAWSMLGSLYSVKKAENEADFCFRIASRLMGHDFSSVEEWNFVGPFTIGKSEFDGDPLALHGGFQNVSRDRFDSFSRRYLSELSENGETKWTFLQNSKRDEYVQVRPNVDWNDLVSSLSSMGITEWQGWLLGEFVATRMDQTLSVQCFGVARCMIDDVTVAGDFYSRTDYWTPVRLSRGVHQVLIPLRAKVAASFKFSISKKSNFHIMAPSFLPQIYDGYLPKEIYLSIPISNQMSEKWLKVNKVSVQDSTNDYTWKSVLHNKEYNIAPGQTMHTIVKLFTDKEQKQKISPSCKEIHLEIKIKTSEGSSQIHVTLECRTKGSSFIFTFLDHDGSVQHAAAIEPLKSCPDDICPVLLTLHGTTVPPQNQADSYKKMVKKFFEFGVANMWLLAPTRHGAHNWEGPGALTAMAALHALHTMVLSCSWLPIKVNPWKILFAGHSMGGHGALHLASHFPDRAIGLMSLAGWIKKEDYGDSNLFFRHDVATSHADPVTKSIMESCVAENDADRHVSNLKDVPVKLRIGARDRTVHPYFLRRMFRLMKEANIDVHYSELPKLEHWWWDTKDTNDGGCMNDADIRGFVATAYASLSSEEKSQPSKNRQQGNSLTFVTFNPAFGETLKGVRVLQQVLPMRKSTIEIECGKEELILSTKNVQCLELTDKVSDAAVLWTSSEDGALALQIDGGKLIAERSNFPLTFCRSHSHWQKSNWQHITSTSGTTRNPGNYGPARRVAERKFIIVAGTQGNRSVTTQILSHATYIANHFLLTSDALAPIVNDTDIENYNIDDKNLIVIGNQEENSLAEKYVAKLNDLQIDETHVSLGEFCEFRSSQVGILTLAPHGNNGLALLLMGRSMAGLADVIGLATPTIPPMARSPFSNLLPDFVITGPHTALRGPGGFECVGFWNNDWKYTVASSSCVCLEVR